MSRQFKSTNYFWDCSCYEDYIHPSSVDASKYCENCGDYEDQSPDSRLNEVISMLTKEAETHGFNYGTKKK